MNVRPLLVLTALSLATGCATYNFDQVKIETTVIGKGCRVERGQEVQAAGQAEGGVSLPTQEGMGGGAGTLVQLFSSDAGCVAETEDEEDNQQ